MMRIAVIGAGISGLASAWLLNRHHAVTLYEAAPRLGGHSNTVVVQEGPEQIPVDTGFIVFNDRNYPHLCALFERLEVASEDSDMSFAASLAVRGEEHALEYAGDNLAKLFAQPRNLFRRSHWRMLMEILRFNRTATDWLDNAQRPEQTVGQFLHEYGFGEELTHRYLLPMAAAIWSAPMGKMMDFPAGSFLAFFRNHGLLQVKDRPQWRTVCGGSQEYVKRIKADLSGRVLEGTAVSSIKEGAHGLLVRDQQGHEAEFDHVILASHADQSLAMLDDADEHTREILGAFKFQSNRAYLHSDRSLMPKRQRLWASWNYLAQSDTRDDSRVAVSYWMNRLQSLNSQRDYFLTLNPPKEPDPALTWYQTDYDHPVFDQKAVNAQSRLKEIQGQRGLWFAGAWTGYGFHEDGMRSAISVANALGVKAPWQDGAEPTPTWQPDPALAGEA